ncbi:hypothetical protein [Mesorhizobium sp.]|nr:hypothetical protein [Mesorhizobium sp.]
MPGEKIAWDVNLPHWMPHQAVMDATKALLTQPGRQERDPDNQWKEMLK